MRFSELMRRVGALKVRLSGDPEVRRVIQDSREAQPGDLFVAVRGLTVDGHTYLNDVVRAGASAVVVEDDARVPTDTPHAVVADTRVALAKLASAVHGDPTRAFTLVGITGTNGKTTTTYLVEAIAHEAGLAAGVIGTVGYRYAGRTLPSPHTTPDPVALQRLFADMRDAGTRVVAMETSSHALEQRRVEGCDFAIAAFSNLTQDHLDYHGSMEAYFEAKARLFTELLPASHATATASVINLDDAHGEALAARCAGRVLTYSKSRADADVRAANVRLTEHGIAADVHTPNGIVTLDSPLVGAFNLENLLCAIAIGVALQQDTGVIGRALAGCRGAPGRLERVDNTRGLSVFVDYAHTPDALERVLSAVRAQTRGRVLVVFGCGGDRDRTKRPLMGGIAARLSDLAIITSDNPRTEDPDAIIAMIVPGARAEGVAELAAQAAQEPAARGFVVEPDRRRAIALAMTAARPGDCVVIAGKGHEEYQILGKAKVHFDDREEARAALEALS